MSVPAASAGRALARLGFERVELAAGWLERLGAWPPDTPDKPDGKALLDELAGSAKPDLAARVLADLVTAHELASRSRTPEPDGLAARLRGEPGLRARTVALAAASRSLGGWLVAHPDEAERLGDDDRFEGPRPVEELREAALTLAAEVAGTARTRATLEPAWEALRRFKRREFVRVAVRDLLRVEASTEQVGAELAALADACLAAALWLAARAEGDPPVRLALIAMGKLGGQELNYVSDIDVLAVHEATEDVGLGAMDAARAAGRIVQGVVAGLAASSVEGRCYRVDLNLRPEGRDGPLSRTLGAYQAYWDRWAEPWEFQALIKARPAAGDPGLGERWLAEARARVYPERLEASTIAEIRRMKARIEASVRGQGADRHVKHGPGGIRDIEWAVQLLQLVHARRDPGLRDRSTLGALAALADAALVGRADADQLAAAYRFLRALEHGLQLSDERQTHVLPDDPDELRRLAKVLGYRDWRGATALEAFEADRRRHAGTVRTLHEQLFYRPLLEAFGAVPALELQAEQDRLVSLGFAAPDRALAHLRALTVGLSRSAALMRVMLPVLLPRIAAAPDPDGGLLALRTLAERLGDRPAFLTILRENAVAAERLCTVLGSSPLLGELMAHHPELVDAFAAADGFESARDPAELVEEARALVNRRAELGSIGGAWDALRRFKRREFVRVAVRDLLGFEPSPAAVGQELTAVAEACLAAALGLAARAAGRPPVRVALIGMGKLAGRELDYVSDLDLVAVHEGDQRVPTHEAAIAAGRIVQHLVKGLAEVTMEGSCYKVDLDLRPEGKDGPLSRTLGAYRAYWDRWAEPWEFQALVRARPVAGDGNLGERLLADASAHVFRGPLAPEVLAELRRIKARVERERIPRGVDPRLHLKLGPGAVADVEWTAQLLQLQHGPADPSLRVHGTREALERLAAAGHIDQRERAWLAEAYGLCTRLRNIAYLVTGRPTDQLPTDQLVLTRMARALGMDGERQQLVELHRRATRRARQVVEERFWGGRLGDSGG